MGTFGITRYFSDGWGAYERHLEAEQHTVGKAHTQKSESKHINMRTRIKRDVVINLNGLPLMKKPR